MGYTIIQKDRLKTASDEKLTFSPKMIPRESYIFAHHMIHGYPNVSFDAYDIKYDNEDVQIAERLLESYRKAIEDEKHITGKPCKDLWVTLKEHKHNDFVEVLERNDPSALARYLCNMSKLNITYGMTQGFDDYNRLVSDTTSRQISAAYYMDKFVALAEAISCLPYENPECGKWGENYYTDVDELVSKIEKIIGIEITPPRISSGLFGLVTKKGLFHFRDINSIYTAWRIRELIKKEETPSVCEIGGGTGRVAYYCYKMGIRDYTIIDLPYVCVVSGYYLVKSLPDANIYLYGEKKDENANSITIKPYWCHKELPNDSFDLTLNQDSFPEIEYHIVMEYLQQIKRTTKQFFLSINQESRQPQTVPDNLQLVIPQLIKQLENSYERFYRFRYWVREGYVEELYKIIK